MSIRLLILLLSCVAVNINAQPKSTSSDMSGYGTKNRLADLTYERFQPNNHIVLNYKLVNGNLLINTSMGRFQRIGPNQYLRTNQLLDAPNTLSTEQISIVAGELIIVLPKTIAIDLKGVSVRFISQEYVGTYSGVFNRGKTLNGISHCSGAIRTFRDTTYICWDGLSIYHGDTLLNTYSGDFVGDFKILDKNYGRLGDIYVHDNTWSLFTDKGIFRLDRRNDILDTIYQNKNSATTIHAPYLNITNDIAYNSVWLMLLKNGDIKKITTFDSDILDISRAVHPTVTTDDGVFLYDFETDNKTLLIEGSFHNCQYLNQDYLIATSNHGLFRINVNTKTIDTLLLNEFNHNSLLVKSDTIYAGSVNGLYKVDVNYFTKYISIINTQLPTRVNHSILIKVLMTICFLVSLFILLIFIKRKKSTLNSRFEKDVTATKEIVERYIYENITIVTIDNLRSHFNLSQNTLYEICAPVSPGTIIKNERIRIVKNLLKTNASIELLVERSGFSKTYLKRTVIPELTK